MGDLAAPITLKFDKKLSQEEFDALVQEMFAKGENQFELWGNPIQLGPRKVHVYGADRKTLQPVWFEVTPSYIVMVAKKDACRDIGGKIARNLCRFLSADIDFYLGAKYISRYWRCSR